MAARGGQAEVGTRLAPPAGMLSAAACSVQPASTQTAPSPSALDDLALLLRSRYALIHLETAEEERAGALLRQLAARLQLPLFVWRRAKGLQREGTAGPIYGTEDLRGAFAHVECARFPALYCFHGVGEDLTSAELASLLREAIAPYETTAGAVVLCGAGLALPESLRPLSAVVQLPAPTPDEYRSLIDRIHRDVSLRQHLENTLTLDELAQLVGNLRGLSLTEAGKLLTKAMVEDGKLSAADITLVVQAKKEIVEREGLLEYFPVEQTLADVAGLEGLKQWLRQRHEIVREPERAAAFGLEFPKGILLLGVPGCGKSLCAKAVASEWRLSLLKLDPGNLYNKYVGESERNFKRALATAERCAPIVLWIDELEKAFAAGDQDGGTSTRVLGAFLSWLQERKPGVFVVATANDVARLPPEFLRKGRFDEIFFVDLPGEAARQGIFQVHLRRRGQDPSGFDLGALVGRSAGFSGAEIEQCLVAALFAAFAARAELTTDGILRELGATQPLSVTMAEKVAALRRWAQGRVRSAD